MFCCLCSKLIQSLELWVGPILVLTTLGIKVLTSGCCVSSFKLNLGFRNTHNYLNLGVAVNTTAKLGGFMASVARRVLALGVTRADGRFSLLLLSPAATLPDPASDHACRPGHHPAHVHPVHQPDLRRPSHTSDRGLSRDGDVTANPSTFAVPPCSDERISFCVSVILSL